MCRRTVCYATLLALTCWTATAAAQEVAVDASQSIGTAFAFSVEPTIHFVNTLDAGGAESTLVGDGLGLGANARAMLFPMAQPNGALGLGLQAGAGYAQLFNAGSGLVVASVGARYVLGAPRTAYWVDVNGGYGVSSDENIGGAPYLDIGIGWQFASAPTFMWGIAGRWSFFFPREPYEDPAYGASERNYSMLSLALVLEWGPPRWQAPAVTPIPIAQGATPVQAQPGQVQQVYTQPGPAVVQPQPVAGPGPAPGPAAVRPIPIANSNQNPGPVTYSNAPGPADQDGDGVPDDADACPAYAEDMNGHADTDGCPDADRDADGVPDVLDRCPDRAEDFDADRDDDGCPD